MLIGIVGAPNSGKSTFLKTCFLCIYMLIGLVGKPNCRTIITDIKPVSYVEKVLG